ncbi:uncharacterized protein VTP21DRAFT_4020 [Calcarisporiella thermophila]|uniref:uncharacterized protein n=1 Tax=Calcarisporiella thermophila TaxID=911321 RepID=UPI0037437D76
MLLDLAKDYLNQYSADLDKVPVRYVAGTLAAAGIAALLFTEKKKNYPPMVPYSLPLVGHTNLYKQDPKGFIASCAKKYGPVFRLIIEGKEVVVVDRNLVVFTTSQKHIDFMEAIYETTNIHSVLDFPVPTNMSNHEFVAEFVKQNLTRRLEVYVPRVAKLVQQGYDKWLGDIEGEKTLCGFVMLQDVVVAAAGSAMVGEELCNDESLKAIFKRVVSDIAPTFTRRFPAYTKLWESFLFWYYDVPYRNLRELRAIIKPEVERRMHEREQQGASWVRPNDLLQDFMDDSPPNVPVDYYVTKGLHSIAFAAMHTTSMFGSIVIYAMAKYQEFIEELVQEQREIHAVNPEITSETLKQMVKLDSFIRESMRRSNPPIGLTHKVLKDTKLPNGMDVNKGAHISINFISTHETDENGEMDAEFKPFRFVGKAKTAVKPGVDFLSFGFGKHTCPGRFFAISEIKYLAAILLRGYEFRLEDPASQVFSYFQQVPTSNIVFKKRTDFA